MTTTSDFSASAKAHAAELGRTAKETASARVTEEATRAKGAAAQELNQAADAAANAADAFDPGSMQAEASRQVAQHLEGFAQQIRGADMSATVQQVSGFARRHPALFIGAAAAAGFAASRFLKARDPDRPVAYPASGDPWADPQNDAFAGSRAAVRGASTEGEAAPNLSTEYGNV